ncbi:MAG: S6e family ribosomal protein [Nanoarchaeota archaeon]
MAFKINIGTKTGKTYKLEAEAQGIIGKTIGEIIKGEEISPDLHGYEFEITGASDKAGFPSLKQVEGIALKRVLLTYGKGMHKRSRREGKKHRTAIKPQGLRLRKTIRGKLISDAMMQINLKQTKEGHKKLEDVFQSAIKEEIKVEAQ